MIKLFVAKVLYFFTRQQCSIIEVAVSGESGDSARVCDFDWILDIRHQCIKHNIPFCFHQTGAKLLKNGKLYRIKRAYQIDQAKKANIDYMLQCKR